MIRIYSGGRGGGFETRPPRAERPRPSEVYLTLLARTKNIRWVVAAIAAATAVREWRVRQTEQEQGERVEESPREVVVPARCRFPYSPRPLFVF